MDDCRSYQTFEHVTSITTTKVKGIVKFIYMLRILFSSFISDLIL